MTATEHSRLQFIDEELESLRDTTRELRQRRPTGSIREELNFCLLRIESLETERYILQMRDIGCDYVPIYEELGYVVPRAVRRGRCEG